MKNFKKILFPVDLSDISPQIVPYVKEIAVKFQSEIHILFVARIFEYFSGMYVADTSIISFQKEVLEGAEKRLEEFRATAFNDYPGTVVQARLGDISEVILNYIEEKGIDLLVMGTHGRKGLDKVFFGSVAERVAKIAPVPVLLVNPYRITKKSAS